jgi:thioredoxin reductase
MRSIVRAVYHAAASAEPEAIEEEERATMRAVELVVVGGGVAGTAAARAAARRGVAVLLVDEQPLGASAYRRNVPYWFGPRAARRPERAPDLYGWLAAHPMLGQAVEDGIDVRLGCSVWGVFPDGESTIVGLFDGQRTELVRARAIILATGATDLHLAFPGWTLGGVLGGLGASALLETSGYLEAQRLLLLGTGRLAVDVARRAKAAGSEVVGLVDVDAGTDGDTAGVRVWPHHTIRRASGGADVEAVTLARVEGQRVLDTEDVTLAVDAVCVAIGQQPAIELAALAQCQLTYGLPQGGWHVAHAADGATSRPGIFVAGDIGGVHQDGAAAVASGERASRAAVTWLASGVHTWRSEPVIGATNVFASRWHALAETIATEATIICRCEEISRGEVLRTLRSEGATDPNEIKRISRAGMGVCQGRGCRPLVAGLVAQHTGRRLAEVPLSRFRPPVRSIPLRALATEEDADGPLLEPFGAANFTLPRPHAE